MHGRSTTSKDNRTLNKIWETFHFIEVKPMSAAASAQINITDVPPVETNENTFTLAGTAAEGVKLTAVTMGLNYPKPILTEVTVGANGKFKMPVTLPKEGVYLLTLTGENQGEEVVELAYPVTYSRTLLPVVLKNDVPDSIETDTLTIAGTSQPGASVQLFLNSEAIGTKKVTSEGKFSIDFTLKQEGVYEIGLVFSKKNLSDRRLVYTVTRKWSDADTLKQLKKEAVKPGLRHPDPENLRLRGQNHGLQRLFPQCRGIRRLLGGPYGPDQKKRQLFRHHPSHLQGRTFLSGRPANNDVRHLHRHVAGFCGRRRRVCGKLSLL